MILDPVRRLAWDVLQRAEQDENLDAALDAALARLQDERDRRFLAELVKGTLRWRGRYDHLIQRFSRRDATTPPQIADVLRLGLHQLLGMDRVPDHAAVHQSVALARDVAGPWPAPFVNGLLQSVRRAAGDAPIPLDALRPMFPDPARDPDGWLAAWWSHPRWLVARWRARYGLEGTAELCRCNNLPPPLAVHVLAPADPHEVAARLADAGRQARPGELCPRALLLESEERAALAALLLERPELIVQDEAVQAACDLLLDGVAGPALDLCAAPGGKTARLRAALGAGELLVAADLSARRLRKLQAAAKRIDAGPALVVSADGRAAPFRAGSFATVLLDGPCTGTGVLRRHPEGRWRLRPESVAASADRLTELAHQAAGLLRPGGRLLYATCSLEPEENEDVLHTILAAHPSLAPCPWHANGEWARTWLPQREGADGFFAARLYRQGEAS